MAYFLLREGSLTNLFAGILFDKEMMCCLNRIFGAVILLF